MSVCESNVLVLGLFSRMGLFSEDYGTYIHGDFLESPSFFVALCSLIQSWITVKGVHEFARALQVNQSLRTLK